MVTSRDVTAKKPSAGYELLGHKHFREFWLASLGSNLGLVTLQLASAWIMTSLTPNPLLVALVQTAVSLPFFFFSIPFGLVTDRFGYRTTLLAANAWMLLPAVALYLLAWRGTLTPWLLLCLLFLTGVGLVMHKSAWQPLLHDLVPREKLVAAVSLNSLNNDLAQAVGPIIGGYLMGLAGAPAVYAIRVVGQILMLFTLRRAPDRPAAQPDEPATLAGLKRSLAQGWQFVRGAPQAHGGLIRYAVFIAPCAGVIALLPLEARENIQTEVIGYGGLLTALGVGTTAGVALTPLIHRHIRMNPVATVSLFVFSVSVLGVSQWDGMLLDAAFLLVMGFSWGILSVCHQISVQSSCPDSLRGRVTSFYILTLQGSMALGSVIFGWLAEYAGVSRTIMICGFVAMAGLLLVRRFPLSDDAPVAGGSGF